MTSSEVPQASPGMPRELAGLAHRALTSWRDARSTRASRAAILLADAIADGDLRVAYQPIVDLVDHRVISVEALVRLDQPASAELDNAQSLIAVAEGSGLISALGAYVLSTSCTQLAHWRQRGAHELQVHVNVSPIELRDPGYLDRLQRILRITGLPPTAVVLEITETAALEREGAAQHALVSLAALGIEIALDDFGTGFASLDLLAATPARTLKLDRSFIAAVGADTEAVRGRAVIVQAAIGLGRSLGLEIVAEGIETSEQAHTLLAWGCQFGQGYLFSRPVRPGQLDLRAATARRSSPLTKAVAAGRLLSTEGIDLALSLACVLGATDADDGDRRRQAASVAGSIAGVLGTGRDHADASVVLAGIADAPDRLTKLTADPASGNDAARELLDLLAVPPVIGRHTLPGAIARTAWALATAKVAGHSSYDPVLLAAHPDPVVDTALRAEVDRWWAARTRQPAQRSDLRALEQRLRGRDDAAQRLRALLGLARAIGSTGSLEDVLELTSEEARRALGASSLSVSRWEQENGLIQTLINVGDLADWEEVRPDHETYSLADFPAMADRLLEREMSIETLGSPDITRAESDLLERMGKGSGAAIPIVVNDTVWGELYATSAPDEPAFTLADGPYLSAVASFVGIAISRAEDVGKLSRLVHEDPLTRLANRRKVEKQVTELLEDRSRDAPLSLIMIDVDGLKLINDEYGHAAGDQLLVTVADVLERAAMSEPDGLAGRLGGDEFCVAVTGDAERARQLVERIRSRLAEVPAPQPRLSVGIVTNHGDPETFSSLLERADAAQYAAKRRGEQIVVDDVPSGTDPAARQQRSAETPRSAPRRQHPDEGFRQQLVGVSERWADQLDRDGPCSRDRLQSIGELAVVLLDLNRWTLSLAKPGDSTLRIDRMQLRRARPRGGSQPVSDEVYDLDDYPATLAAFETGYMVIDSEDLNADPSERDLLLEHGLTYVIGIALTDTDGSRWFLELFGDEHSLSLRVSEPLIAALRDTTLASRPNGDAAS